jgi:hypothetical protein
MTTKPKTRKAPAAGTGISPKMMELAAKIDKATARFEAAKGADDLDHQVISKARGSVWKLEDKLVEMGAGNLKEMKLKARYIVSIRAQWPGSIHALRLAQSIVNDLLSGRI